MDDLQVLDGLQVLVVDDNTDNLDLIQFILEQYNVQVTAVTNAYQALNTITLLNPNILICDIGMPIEDGYSLISKVRNLIQPLKEIPALALTAHASIEALNLALKQGFSTYLTKPFDPDELIQVVSNLAIKHSGLCCQVKDSGALLKAYPLTRGSRQHQY